MKAKCAAVRAIMQKTIGHGGPVACTRAERVAVANHYHKCRDCRRFIDQEAAKERQSLGPLYDAAALEMAVAELVLNDRHDPEAT